MSEAETYAVLWNREAAVEAFDARRCGLGMSLVELDAAAGFAAGTSGKYLGPSRVKGLGLDSVLRIAAALGLAIELKVDPAATARVIDERRQRHARQARPNNYAQRVSERVLERALRHLAVLDWSEILRAVKDTRATIAAEQAERAAREEGKPKPAKATPARPSKPSVRTKHGDHQLMGAREKRAHAAA